MKRAVTCAVLALLLIVGGSACRTTAHDRPDMPSSSTSEASAGAFVAQGDWVIIEAVVDGRQQSLPRPDQARVHIRSVTRQSFDTTALDTCNALSVRWTAAPGRTTFTPEWMDSTAMGCSNFSLRGVVGSIWDEAITALFEGDVLRFQSASEHDTYMVMRRPEVVETIVNDPLRASGLPEVDWGTPDTTPYSLGNAAGPWSVSEITVGGHPRTLPTPSMAIGITAETIHVGSWNVCEPTLHVGGHCGPQTLPGQFLPGSNNQREFSTYIFAVPDQEGPGELCDREHLSIQRDITSLLNNEPVFIVHSERGLEIVSANGSSDRILLRRPWNLGKGFAEPVAETVEATISALESAGDPLYVEGSVTVRLATQSNGSIHVTSEGYCTPVDVMLWPEGDVHYRVEGKRSPRRRCHGDIRPSDDAVLALFQGTHVEFDYQESSSHDTKTPHDERDLILRGPPINGVSMTLDSGTS